VLRRIVIISSSRPRSRGAWLRALIIRYPLSAIRFLLTTAGITAFMYLSATDADGAEPYTTNTLQLRQDERSPPASIRDMSWLAGTWRGTGFGGDIEEIWSAPRNGEMIGMYRMLKDGSPALYELLVLSEVDGSLVLRLRHFDAQFHGWEERDASVAFAFVAERERRMYFSGLTFERHSGGDLVIYVAIESQDGSLHEEAFRYKRVSSPSSSL
jgi:hypothetical protein